MNIYLIFIDLITTSLCPVTYISLDDLKAAKPTPTHIKGTNVMMTLSTCCYVMNNPTSKLLNKFHL